MNNNMEKNIVPVVFSKRATKIVIGDINVVLDLLARIIVFYKDDDDNTLETAIVVIDGEDYSNWGLDDEYLINKVLEKLNLIKLE
jgi:hypothetical protein